MDSKQTWYGYYFKLEQVNKFLSSLSETAFRRTKVHELFITWVVARFLQFQKKSEHVIGFPVLEEREGLVLSDFLNNDIVLDNDNFDTVITDISDLKTPIRLQIKRYTWVKDANTEDFYKFMCKKVRRYGSAPEINLVFHIHQKNMKFNFPKFGKLLKGENFGVGSIIAFSATQLKQKCFLFEIFPNYTGVLWYPVAKDVQNQND